MNLRKIKALDKKVRKEVEKAIKQIYASHNVQMNRLLAEATPKNITLTVGNGMAILRDKSGNELISGKAWGNASEEVMGKKLDTLADLQYSRKFRGSFTLKDEIKGRGKKKIA